MPAGQAALSEPRRGLRRVGLIGGTSWTSTVAYYTLLNQALNAELGGSASAPVTIHSVNFADITALQERADWDAQGAILAAAAKDLEAGGAETIAVCANTLHLCARHIADAVGVPFIDLIDLVAKACSASGVGTVGLLGTRYTMNSSLYADRLAEVGVEVIIPADDDVEVVHSTIYTELTKGIISEPSRLAYLDVIDRLKERGAELVILGCTELGLLVADGDAGVPLLDTTALHCNALVDFMLADRKAAI